MQIKWNYRQIWRSGWTSLLREGSWWRMFMVPGLFFSSQRTRAHLIGPRLLLAHEASSEVESGLQVGLQVVSEVDVYARVQALVHAPDDLLSGLLLPQGHIFIAWFQYCLVALGVPWHWSSPVGSWWYSNGEKAKQRWDPHVRDADGMKMTDPKRHSAFICPNCYLVVCKDACVALFLLPVYLMSFKIFPFWKGDLGGWEVMMSRQLAFSLCIVCMVFEGIFADITS